MFWPVMIGSVIAYEGYKYFFKKGPSSFPVIPNRLYFAQAMSTGPNPNPDVLVSDLIGVGLTPTQGILRDTKNPQLWSFLVKTGNEVHAPTVLAVVSSRLNLIKLDDRGTAGTS
jgi:hypothetical protein